MKQVGSIFFVRVVFTVAAGVAAAAAGTGLVLMSQVGLVLLLLLLLLMLVPVLPADDVDRWLCWSCC